MNSKQTNLMWIKATGPPRVPYLHPPEAPPDNTSTPESQNSSKPMWIKTTGPPNMPYHRPPKAPPDTMSVAGKVPVTEPVKKVPNSNSSSSPSALTENEISRYA